MPFFTVVIPTYNRAEKLKYTVCSVLKQTYSDFELLVMDDGSSDHTKAVVSSFADRRICYEWAQNSGGPATPRNRGISAASAPWITFLDADDIWYETRLAEVAEAIARQPEVDVFCHNELLNTIGSDSKSLLQYGPFERDFYRILLTQGNRLSTSAVTIRTDFLLRHQLRFNQSRDYVIVEDYDLWLHLANSGAQFCFLNSVLGEYIMENDNISQAVEKVRYNQKVLLKDHVYKIQSFEPNRDKLWCEICLRLDLEESRELWVRGEVLKGLRILVARIFVQPLNTLKVLSAKLRNRVMRVRLA